MFGKCILFLKMVKKKSRPIGGNTFFEVERAMGIEPTSKAWEAFILPMNYIRMDLFVTKSLYSELLLM